MVDLYQGSTNSWYSTVANSDSTQNPDKNYPSAKPKKETMMNY